LQNVTRMAWIWMCLLLVGCTQTVSRPELLTAAVPAAVLPQATALLSAKTAVSPTSTPDFPTVVTSPTVIPPTDEPIHIATAVPLSRLPLPVFSTILNAKMAETAVTHHVEFLQVAPENTGLWQFEEGNFTHPIALTGDQNSLFMIDAGRVLMFDRAAPAQPIVLLAPGDMVAGVRVLEPLDVSIAADGLLVLDRAGDVYRYYWHRAEWVMDRYDRPIGDSSGYYYVAVDGDENGRYLLETSYGFVRRYETNMRGRLWTLPESRGIDVAAKDGNVFVLTQSNPNNIGWLRLYRNTRYISRFLPNIDIVQPRQVVATETAVWVLDMAGQRLLKLHPETGKAQAIYQMPAGVTAVWSEGDMLIFAGKNQLFWWGNGEETIVVSGKIQPISTDPFLFASFSEIIFPIVGTQLTQRDLQMPGAPRHYRLGVHEGIDFYWRRGTAVYAIANGIVIRVSHDYQNPTADQFEKQHQQIIEAGYTPQSALDMYRGMQIWIRHENGIVSRYAHLSTIQEGIVEGVVVIGGQWLGEIGNSGSPSSVNSENADAHLHFELWNGKHFLGQFLRPIEARELVEQLFSKKD
jgi:hypothetical protein